MNEIEAPSTSQHKLCPGVLSASQTSTKDDSEADDVGINGKALTFSTLATEQVTYSIGPSEPMQNDQTCFFSNIFLKFYNIIKIII
jgi:hypothetical protein